VGTPDQGGQVVVQSDLTSLRYTPREGFVGLETFTYDVEDEEGQEASARVTVQVEAPVANEDRVQFRLEVAGPDGKPLPELRVGEPFTFAVYVQDIRPSGTGVATAFLDISFAAESVAAAGSIEHGPAYSTQTSGQVTVGQIDEAGGRTDLSLGTEEQLLFRVPFKARRRGPITFTLEPADEAEHTVELTGVPEPIPPVRWLADPLTVVIASFQNESEAEDVDNDGWITPLDALLVINDLNNRGARDLTDTDERPEHLIDVNGDDYVSAVDALLIINRLNSSSTGLGAAGRSKEKWSAEALPEKTAGIEGTIDDLLWDLASLDLDDFLKRRSLANRSLSRQPSPPST
jgi:hypothetical protein